MAKKRRSSANADTGTKPKKSPGRGAWKVMDRGSRIAAGLLAHRAATISWRAVTGKKPPTSSRHPEVNAKEAVAWAVVSGALVELVMVGVRRGAANYWVKSTGALPPGMKPLVKDGGTTKEPALTEPAPTSTSTKKLSRRSRGR